MLEKLITLKKMDYLDSKRLLLIEDNLFKNINNYNKDTDNIEYKNYLIWYLKYTIKQLKENINLETAPNSQLDFIHCLGYILIDVKDSIPINIDIYLNDVEIND